MSDEQPKLELTSAGAKHIQAALGKAVPDAAFDFGIILAIITALAPVIGGCFGSSRRVRKSIQTGNDSFLIANFSAAHKNGLTPAESVRFCLAMKAECADAKEEDIDEFINLTQAAVI